MAQLARIEIFPIKSCDGLDLPEAVVLPSGALENDRRWALVDPEGTVVNGKLTPAFHRIRTRYSPAADELTLWEEGEPPRVEFQFDLRHPGPELAAMLSGLLGISVRLVENRERGFPDDTEAPGPTVVSTATLAAVGGWFDLSVDEVRRRFRANLEIDGVEPFWEDRLVAQPNQVVRFRVGAVELLGTNPCQRCIVPTRNPATGAMTPAFAKRFSKLREEHLPAWAATERFNHFYRLSVNTRVAVASTLAVGDEVVILGVEPSSI